MFKRDSKIDKGMKYRIKYEGKKIKKNRLPVFCKERILDDRVTLLGQCWESTFVWFMVFDVKKNKRLTEQR